MRKRVFARFRLAGDRLLGRGWVLVVVDFPAGLTLVGGGGPRRQRERARDRGELLDSGGCCAAAACDGFRTFYSDMTTYTPHAWSRLIADLTPIVRAATYAVNGNEKWRKLANDADDLSAYVGRTDFPTQGNILGRPIEVMQDDCPLS